MSYIYIFIAIALDETSIICCTSFLDAKHLPVMWSMPRRGAEQNQRQPVTFFIYWRLRDLGHVLPWR